MDASLATGIREELRCLVAAAGTRRSLPPRCHVGHPGGDHTEFVHADVEDPSMRADLVERAIDGLLVTDNACAWITRSGELGVGDADAEWFAAARTAFARHGLTLPAFFVLNRSGWTDLVSGERRQWSRLRAAPRPAATRPRAS
jgi:hypothetical protein